MNGMIRKNMTKWKDFESINAAEKFDTIKFFDLDGFVQDDHKNMENKRIFIFHHRLLENFQHLVRTKAEVGNLMNSMVTDYLITPKYLREEILMKEKFAGTVYLDDIGLFYTSSAALLIQSNPTGRLLAGTLHTKLYLTHLLDQDVKKKQEKLLPTVM